MNTLTILSLSWQHVLILLLFIPIYFIPTFIALNRKKSNAGAIFALNLFLGWALIGWIGALIWSLSKDKTDQQRTIENNNSNIDQLTQLKKLHDQGVITDQEFETQKNKLLQ
ncbi:superinfection immunity protein [Chryseobacterium camelliae]|uniref:superinfection immunity protein n=1 Tax=Chryseobacterium camelliae TaxID=1265445 RepID=UPI002857C269|nr:superinfection immunity protein [Chryseobacterium camelliae]MDR6517281.1 Na+/proline symporter [Chryseobacterium camelliae]